MVFRQRLSYSITGGEKAMGSNQRADAKNPNNSSYKATTDNRADQLNPNNAAYRSSRGKK